MEKEKYKPIFNDGLTKDQRYYRRHRKFRNCKDNKKYYQEHKEYYRNFGKNRDKEKHRKICKLWRINNRERINFLNRLNKARRRSAGELSIRTFQQVYEDNIKQYGTLTCYLCLQPIPFGKDHLEHKMPVSRGGTNEYNNLAISCCKCNLSKNDKTVEEYLLTK